MMWGKSLGWWYWLGTALLIGASLFGFAPAGAAALALCTLQLAHFALLERNAVAFPVQVRAAFLAMLLAGAWEPLRVLHWIQFFGTSAFVLFGYCLLARLLSLLPWNRREPLTGTLVTRTLLSPPQRGNVLQGLPPEPSCCRTEARAAQTS